MNRSTTTTKPCPADRFGEAHQCYCLDDIPIGAPAMQNADRQWVHPQCIGIEHPGQYVAARTEQTAGPGRVQGPAGDFGDHVAAILTARRATHQGEYNAFGKPNRPPHEPPLAPPTNPATPAASVLPGGLGAQGDLGDQIVAILEQRRGKCSGRVSAAPAPAASVTSGDLGDQIVAELEQRRSGNRSNFAGGRP